MRRMPHSLVPRREREREEEGEREEGGVDVDYRYSESDVIVGRLGWGGAFTGQPGADAACWDGRPMLRTDVLARELTSARE